MDLRDSGDGAADALRIRQRLLERFGLRVEEGMCRYVLRRLTADAAPVTPGEPIAVIGGDARTGVPVRRLIDPRQLMESKPR